MQTTIPSPRSNLAQRWWQVFLVGGALLVMLTQGMSAMRQLTNEAQADMNSAGKIALPTTTVPLTPSQYANLLLNQMPLRDKIAQMIMIKLVGPTVSTNEAQMIGQQHVGAVLAFGDAILNPTQVEHLTSGLQARASIPIFVATDQEGGFVNRFQPLVGARPREDQLQTPAAATAAGLQTAQDFGIFGFNMNLAPVVDINEYNTTSQLYGRTFSSDPNVVAQLGDAYLQGFQSSGQYVAVIKHFPGLGATSTDPHLGLPIVYKTVAQLTNHEFVPYRELFATTDVHAVMVTHIMLPKIDPTYPATLSYKITTGLLRQQLGFQGLIVTDALDMDAIAAQYPIDQAALLATKAGADILMGPSTPDQVSAVIDTISAAIDSGQVTEQRINDSVARILTQKITQGLIPLPTMPPTPTSPPTATPIVLPTATVKAHH